MAKSKWLQVLLFAALHVGSMASPMTGANGLVRRDDACNGNAALCDRRYSNISYVGTHDSPFVGPLPSQNQEKSVADQLTAGIRFLQSQIHPIFGTPYMCHTNCMLENAGTLQSYLQTVKSFLDQNPREVVTLLITNPEHMAMSKLSSVFSKVGADKLAFVPSTSPNPLAPQDWPTLGDLISSGKRLVVFVDYNASEKDVPYLLDEFNYFFEGPYDTTDPDFNQCDMDRQNKIDNAGADTMYLINHYLDMQIGKLEVPDRLSASTTNAAEGSGSIGAQVDLCTQKWGRPPSVILVDYFGEGNELGAQTAVNGL